MQEKRRREYQRQRRTGASPEQFEKTLEGQLERCAICEKAFVYRHLHPRSPVQDHFPLPGAILIRASESSGADDIGLRGEFLRFRHSPPHGRPRLAAAKALSAALALIRG
jgi:hypothetical protein